MVARRFTALLFFLSFLWTPTTAKGVFEIDQVGYEVDERIAAREEGRDTYKLEICLNDTYACEDSATVELRLGKSSNSIIFDKRPGYWNGYRLELHFRNSLNLTYHHIQNTDDQLFQPHEWKQETHKFGFFTLTLRHRFFCEEGFYGIHCDKVVTTPEVTTTTPTPADPSNQPSESHEIVPYFFFPALALVLIAVTFSVAFLLYRLCSRRTNLHALHDDPETGSQVSVATLTSSLSSGEDSEDTVGRIAVEVKEINECE
ncbi:hypothetical protein QR680_016818 [Steinernema hermaphroditum]|uniref:Uncharacterized protein n=1 Tax=Steinernema hermaphroditum TaxID=289476 RepID=A0AA39HCU1_9BILA|nr:hypothetical protein QR680_016818 [Steinernema hermaphroditum]